MAKKLNIFHMDFNYVCLKMDYLKKWLKRVADMGFNAVLWELEDKIKWETCPECVWPEAISKEEFRDLLDYSRSLGLEPIPLLQTIGHAEYVLSHDKYKNLREKDDQHDCYCTSNPEAVKFLTFWIEEYLELFGSIRFFHLGGDEAYVFGSCSKCSEFVDKYGKNKLYSDHINALAEPILKKNVRPGIWNDMIMHYPESVDLISRDFVIWDWNYWDEDKSPEKLLVRNRGWITKEEIDDELLNMLPELLDKNGNPQQFYSVKTVKKLGFDIILCSAANSAGDNFFCPAQIHIGNIVGAASTVIEEDILGNCVTSWAIRLNGFIVQIPFIGLASPAMKNPGESSNKLYYEHCESLFGIKPDKFIEAAELLGISLPFAQAHSTGVQWNSLKDSCPAPAGYLRGYINKMKKEHPDLFASFGETVEKVLVDVPRGVQLLSEFFQKAKKGQEIIESWLTASHFLLLRALIAERILDNKKSREIVEILKMEKMEYSTFLRRRETPQSAEKNACLVYDTIIEFFTKGEQL